VRGQPTLLGMPSIPAKICDESPLAGVAEWQSTAR
jgi:hypothetical protein